MRGCECSGKVLPLYDDQKTSTFPVLTILLIAVNTLVFALWQVPLGVNESVMHAALVPAEWTQAPGVVTFHHMINSMFMHGSWMHLIGNMWFMWIFGNNVEDAMGHFRFIIFYLVCGALADFAHIAYDPQSQVPMIGASGAVSGVLGAYLVLHPRASVVTLVPLGIFTRLMELPAFVFLLFWIALQIFSQMASAVPSRHPGQGGGVAYLAHIGGFAAGLALIFFFKKERRSRSVERF